MTKSPYATLNVAPDADPAVIEAAYKALMKKYHPDVVEAGANERRAAEINEAFYILRDPARRAHYDRQAHVGTLPIRVAAPAQNGGAYPFPPPGTAPAAPRRSAGIWFLLLLLVLAAAIFYAWRGSSLPQHLGLTKRSSDASGAAAGKSGSLPEISSGAIDRALSEFSQIKSRSGLFGLASRSQDCFAEQRRSGLVEDFDFCIAFDNAVLTYDPGVPGGLPFPDVPRFEPKNLLSRHLEAGRLVADDEIMIADRLSRIENLVKERIRARAATVPPPASTPMIPNHVAARAEVRPPRFSVVQAPRPRAEPRPRSQRPRQAPKQRRKAADSEFMEREGYIY